MTENSNNGRMVLLLIAGLPLTMILAATWLWVYVEKGEVNLTQMLGTANRGQLLTPPRAIMELGLPAPEAGNGSWTILIPALEACNEECEHLLYYTRQIRTAMGKYTNRINRIYLGLDEAQVLRAASRYSEEHPHLEFLYTSQDQWSGLIDATQGMVEGHGYYLVDPQGWIMMSYQADADGKDVMADLKFLLKNSSG
jgi:hypothetical protein